MKKQNKLFTDLLGGSKLIENTKNDTYEILAQFDNDLPMYVATNIPITDDFKLVFKAPMDSNDENSYIELTDINTGKKIKIYASKK